jgi:sigma-B regulation protein RsbQ
MAAPALAPEVVLRRNSVRLHGHDRGKPALVFVSGFGGEQGMWRGVAPHFVPEHQVVLFDHVGTGRAPDAAFDPRRHATLHGYADDLLAVCDASGVVGAVLIAHAAGAMIAILAAIRRPGAFRQLILMGASPCFLNDGSYLGGFEREDLDGLLEALDSDYPHWLRQLAPLILGYAGRPELAAEVEASLNRMDPAIARRYGRACFASDHRKELARLATPTVILQCADDNLVPEVVGDFMREAIPGCVLVKLLARGHWPHLSQPAEVIAVLEALLDEHWSQTAPAELGRV